MRFYKLQASGNDFILIEDKSYSTSYLKKLAKKLCVRRLSVGADGLLAVKKLNKDNFQMRIFNPDGSEAEMCGNGIRCVAFWINKRNNINKLIVHTKAGKIPANIRGSYVKIKMVDPFGIKLNISFKILRKRWQASYINTGVPHTVLFVKSLDRINVEEIGRKIRFHKIFKPWGTNVDFVEIIHKGKIRVRTYERGVEKETLSCGTGVTASAIIFGLKYDQDKKIEVLTKSGEALKVYFKKESDKINNVWFEGKVYYLYEGRLI